LLLLRKKRGISQKELAVAANTTQAVVSRLENASVKASLESVVKLAEALEAVVDVRLIPLEDVRKKDSQPEKPYKEKRSNDALVGIKYFSVDELAKASSENLKKTVTMTDDLSMLNMSSNPPLTTMKKDKKLREFA
jgi:transcriptional regulator with XRE-family HTH domain